MPSARFTAAVLLLPSCLHAPRFSSLALLAPSIRRSSFRGASSSSAIRRRRRAAAPATESGASDGSIIDLPPEPPLKLPHGSEYHVPVLCREVVEALVTNKEGLYIDGTLGGGGHSAALLEALGPGGRVIGLDRDPEALAEASKRLAVQAAADRFVAIETNFAGAAEALRSCSLLASGGLSGSVDGMLLDLGVSSHQIDAAARGFSFSGAGPLDMRMEGGSSGARQSAADVVNDYDERALRDVFYRLGEERRSASIARAIVRSRPITTTSRLAEVVGACCPYLDRPKTLARIFQALRIEVNGELEALDAALQQARTLMRPGGRLAVLSYHSLEDRRVKRIMASGSLDGQEAPRDVFGNRAEGPWRPLTRKPVVAGPRELEQNRRARSARLRVAERTQTP